MTDEPLDDLPLPPPIDDRTIRRAIRRGVLRVGLVATAIVFALVVMLAAVFVAVAGFLGAPRTERFHTLAHDGMRVAHPEYDIWQDGTCCARGPLFGVTNLGLANSITLRMRPVGALNYPVETTIVVEQDVDGTMHANLPEANTPLGYALQQGRPGKRSTRDFLDGLPAPVVVSALVELLQPVEFAALDLPWPEAPLRQGPLFYSNPYSQDGHNAISWPYPDVDGLRAWADRLDAADDQRLDELGLPRSETIKAVAADGKVHAYVLPRITPSVLAELLADPSVRSVRVLDVAFDTGRQLPE